MSKNKVTTATFRARKKEGRPVSMLTAYDYPIARLVDEAGIDAILVGDSLGNTVLGYESTIPVTMDDMVHHTKAVTRGVKRCMVIADLPFLSYHLSVEEAVRNAGRFLQEAGAQAVKLEGGQEVAEKIKAITDAGIPVMGHLGLTPQSIHQMGGYRVQGKDEHAAQKILEDAQAVEEAGAFSLVLECVPTPLAKLITEKLSIITIGIGAGPYCNGQVLVMHDLIGLLGGFSPKFAKRYINIKEDIKKAFETYRQEVEDGVFPAAEHQFGMDEEVLKKLY